MSASQQNCRILTLAGKRWLAGMTWRCYDKPVDRARIRKEAKALSADVFVQRSGTVRTPVGVEPRYDAGYAAVGSDGLRGKLHSLGAALSGTRPGPWTGIFRLAEDEYFYLQVTVDGAILPDQYGELIGTASDVELARAAHAVPANTTLIEGDRSDIEKLLSGVLSPPLVRPVTRRTRLRAPHVFAIAGACVLFLAVWHGYRWYQGQLEQREQAARLAALARARAAVPPQSPLDATPPPSVWLAACNPDRWALPSIEYGWSLKQYECLSDRVVLTWVRGAGANSLDRPAGTLDTTGDVVTRPIPLSLVQVGDENGAKHTRAAKPVIPPLDTARAQMQAWGERSGIDVQFGAVSPVPGQALSQCVVTITSPLVPWALTSLNSISGLRLNSFRSASDGQWVLEGILYGR